MVFIDALRYLIRFEVRIGNFKSDPVPWPGYKNQWPFFLYSCGIYPIRVPISIKFGENPGQQAENATQHPVLMNVLTHKPSSDILGVEKSGLLNFYLE
jgi:hypothetical protein